MASIAEDAYFNMSSPAKVKPKAPVNVESFKTDYNSDDEESKDKVPEPESVILQNQRRKKSKIGHILENELIRSDTLMRKKPKHVIRVESFNDPTKQADVARRVLENELITSAKVRQASRKSLFTQKQTAASLHDISQIEGQFKHQKEWMNKEKQIKEEYDNYGKPKSSEPSNQGTRRGSRRQSRMNFMTGVNRSDYPQL